MTKRHQSERAPIGSFPTTKSRSFPSSKPNQSITMTNGNNNDQLQQITQNLASITSTLGTLSNGVIENRERIQRLEQFSSDSAERIQTLETIALNQNDTQQTILETQATLARTAEQLTQQQEQLINNQAETRAAIEKIDRVLDYLMRRDGNRGQE